MSEQTAVIETPAAETDAQVETVQVETPDAPKVQLPTIAKNFPIAELPSEIVKLVEFGTKHPALRDEADKVALQALIRYIAKVNLSEEDQVVQYDLYEFPTYNASRNAEGSVRKGGDETGNSFRYCSQRADFYVDFLTSLGVPSIKRHNGYSYPKTHSTRRAYKVPQAGPREILKTAKSVFRAYEDRFLKDAYSTEFTATLPSDPSKQTTERRKFMVIETSKVVTLLGDIAGAFLAKDKTARQAIESREERAKETFVPRLAEYDAEVAAAS